MPIAVIVPTYEEQENVKPLIERIAAVSNRLGEKIYAVFVDDEGTDETSKILSYYQRKFDFIHIIKRSEKRGLSSAYLEGLGYAVKNLDCNFIIQMDGDLQHPPEKLLQFYDLLRDGYDIVIGSRFVSGSVIEEGISARLISSKLFSFIARFLLNMKINDISSGFRGMKKDAARLILEKSIISKQFAYQLETLYIFAKNGMKMVEVPFAFSRRKAGKSKLLAYYMLEYFKCLIYCMVFGFRLRRTNK